MNVPTLNRQSSYSRFKGENIQPALKNSNMNVRLLMDFVLFYVSSDFLSQRDISCSDDGAN